MFRHVVAFRWKTGTTPEAIAAVTTALAELPALIPQLRGYHLGIDAGVNPGNHDFAVVADFESVDDYLVYRDHPRHRAIFETQIAPNLAERAAVQFAD